MDELKRYETPFVKKLARSIIEEDGTTVGDLQTHLRVNIQHSRNHEALQEALYGEDIKFNMEEVAIEGLKHAITTNGRWAFFQ